MSRAPRERSSLTRGQPAAAAGKSPPPGKAPAAPVATHAIRVLCVDDHAVLVEGLKAQFGIRGGIEVVCRLASAARVMEEVDRLSPHAVILDIELPGPDAFEIADRLRRAHPEVRVIVLSAHIRDAYISAAFAAGASAYFSKSDELEEIENGVHDVMRSKSGTFVLGPKVRERCRPLARNVGAFGQSAAASEPTALSESGVPQTLLDTLTPREVEVLRMIGNGLSRTQIASQLCRSAKTIDGHQERMMKKLGIPARADLMRFAIREGLAEA